MVILNINEIYELLNDTQNFELKEKSSIDFDCPKCQNHLIKFSLKNGERHCEYRQKYLYDDGDTINIHKKYWLKADASMMFGACENCGEKIALINTVILDKELNSGVLSKSFKDCFVVYSEDDLINDFKDVKQYAIELNNTTIGKVVIYKNAIINKNAVHGLKRDVRSDIAVASLDCLSESEDMNISDIGVCNGHVKNKNQFDIWQKSSNIAEKLIDSIVQSMY